MVQHVIHFKGNASGYLHYIGCGLYLRQHYNLDNVKFSGCSAGAIISAIMALDIDFAKAVLIPFQLQPKSKNKFALMGIWKNKLKVYLEEILPTECNYEELKTLRVGVQFIDEFQFFEKYQSKIDLINCLLASSHIPFFMDFKPFDNFRGRICMDGDLLSSYERHKEPGTFHINYEIPFIKSISVKSESDLIALIKKGYQHAATDKNLNHYLKEHRTNSPQDKYLFEFLETIKNSFLNTYKQDLEQYILN